MTKETMSSLKQLNKLFLEEAEEIIEEVIPYETITKNTTSV